MKKVRGMLAAIAVLAVVGGAFAFKAKSAFGNIIYYATTTIGAGTTTCGVEGLNLTTTFEGANLGHVFYTTAVSPAACITTSALYKVQE